MIIWYTDKIENADLGYTLYLDSKEGNEYWYEDGIMYQSDNAGEDKKERYEEGSYTLYRRCKLPNRVEDISGRNINGFLVGGYLGMNDNKRPRPNWAVTCFCGRDMESTRSNMLQNISGCSSCMNKVKDCGEYLEIDVSTDLYKNTYTIVDIKWRHLFYNTRWRV